MHARGELRIGWVVYCGGWWDGGGQRSGEERRGGPYCCSRKGAAVAPRHPGQPSCTFHVAVHRRLAVGVRIGRSEIPGEEPRSLYPGSDAMAHAKSRNTRVTRLSRTFIPRLYARPKLHNSFALAEDSDLCGPSAITADRFVIDFLATTTIRASPLNNGKLKMA
jgi:hypothetical protein